MAAKEACKKVVHQLHAVSLIKSGIRQPWWEKRTLKTLGLTRLHKVVIHKNTPAVNGLLRSVKHLIDVRPVSLVDPYKSQKRHSKTIEQGTPVFLKANGQFDYQKYQDFIASNPKNSETISANYLSKEEAMHFSSGGSMMPKCNHPIVNIRDEEGRLVWRLLLGTLTSLPVFVAKVFYKIFS